jgi:phospho-N-acetylmuramoyl-pentapeptide-transferase
MLYNLVDRLQNALADWGLLWLVQVVFQLEFRAFAATLLAFVAVLVSGPPAIRRLVGLQVGDVAEFHHEGVNALMKAKAQTPTMGGVFLCGSMLLSILLLADLSNRFVQLSVALVLWLCILGAFDDYLKTTAARRGPGSRDGLFASSRSASACWWRTRCSANSPSGLRRCSR